MCCERGDVVLSFFGRPCGLRELFRAGERWRSGGRAGFVRKSSRLLFWRGSLDWALGALTARIARAPSMLQVSTSVRPNSRGRCETHSLIVLLDRFARHLVPDERPPGRVLGDLGIPVVIVLVDCLVRHAHLGAPGRFGSDPERAALVMAVAAHTELLELDTDPKYGHDGDCGCAMQIAKTVEELPRGGNAGSRLECEIVSNQVESTICWMKRVTYCHTVFLHSRAYLARSCSCKVKRISGCQRRNSHNVHSPTGGSDQALEYRRRPHRHHPGPPPTLRQTQQAAAPRD